MRGRSSVRVALLAALAVGVAAAPSGAQAPPPDSSFQKVTLNPHPGEPMGLAVLPGGKVLYTARPGQVRLNDPATGLNTIAADLHPYQHDEEGVQSIAVDPNFQKDKWVYLYYSPVLNTPVDDPVTPVNEGDAPGFGTAADFAPYNGYIQLSRFKFRDNKIDLGTEQKILQVNVNRGICCHVGGHIDFDKQGNLYLSTGDDTNPFESDGFDPIDERPNRNPAFDAQRSAANTNDLRGKVLRIHVRDNGSYTIPPGNLFPQGTPKTRPEIYLMGLRNPFRIAVNRQNNDLYVADYSPDSPNANPLRGPAGTGKWFIARGPGNYGWPYCATDQLPYVDYDFATGASGAAFNCAHPVNESPHNTGLRELPPVKHPDVSYSYATSPEFPQLGTGGVGPMAGPAYHFDRKLQSRTKWPDYYDGQPLFYEWTRDYIKEFRLNSSGALADIRPVLPSFTFDNPMDMQFGPDGSLYTLEYGDGFFSENPEAQLARTDFVRGGRSPVPTVSATPTAGQPPLTVNFSSAGTSDPDGDSLKYQWDFDGDGKFDSTKQNPTFTYKQRGVYDATLKVTDPSGRWASTSVRILVGNQAPVVHLATTPAPGQPFHFGDTVTFHVTVTDDEPVDCSKVLVHYILGHDTHGHPLSDTTGCDGSVVTSAAGHDPSQDNITAVFVAEYTDSPTDPNDQPLSDSDQVVLSQTP
jgi:cytochrome c